jgi:large-conductance mechanosensitive channel
VVVVPMTRLQSLRAKGADAETPAPSDEAKLLTEIRDLLAQRGDGSASGTSPSRPT